MGAFVAKHQHVIRGVLSCFDRVLFRGYVPLMSGYAMAEFLQLKQVQRRTLKAFLLTQAERVKQHAFSVAAAAGLNNAIDDPSYAAVRAAYDARMRALDGLP
jgi:hypothetical protein